MYPRPHISFARCGLLCFVLAVIPSLAPASADTLYGKQESWSATLLAARSRFIAWSAGQAHDAATHRAGELWQEVRRDFPAQSRWMERDTANAAATWFLKRNTTDIEQAMLANLLRIMKASDENTDSFQADINALDAAKAGADDPRWLNLYARLANHVYGRRLDLPHVGEYRAAPYREPVTPETRALSAEESDAALSRDYLFQANDKPGPGLIARELEWAGALARRLASMNPAPDFSRELAELEVGKRALAELGQKPEDNNKVKDLYLAVRKIKRSIAFKNPLLDFSSLLLVDSPRPAASPALCDHESGHRAGYNAGNGGRLLVLDGLFPGGKVTRLAPERPGAFLKPDLHFNARKVVFTFKPHDEDAYHLYEINLDGTGLRQITSGQYDDMDPCYLPDGRFVFLSTRCHSYVRCLPCSPSFVVSRCDADGRNLYLLSFNNEPEYMPSLLSDGRIIYTRWEYTDKALWRVQKLWTMNPDGTGVTTFWGNQSPWPDVMTEARQIPGTQRVMFTGVGHHAWFSGCIGIVNPAEGLNFPHGITKVTADRRWPESGNGPTDPVESTSYHASGAYNSYKTPFPLGEKDFLVSAHNGKFRLYLMDVDGNRELVYEGAHDILYAQPVRPRPSPPVIPDKTVWAGPQDGHAAVKPGVFYSRNVFDGAPPELKRVAKYLRVIQMDPKNYSTWFKAWQHTGPVVSILQADGVKRILGTVPIEADGSVAFKLPPGQAVHFQLLDDRFRAVHSMRSFTGLMPGEQRGCVGCHEMSSQTPAVSPSPMMAMKHAPVDLTEPPWGADTSIGYERFAQPVLDQYCVKCHQGSGEGKAPPDLSLRPSSVAWNHFSNGPAKFGGKDDISPFKEPYVTLLGGAFGWTSVRGNTINESGVPTCLAGCLIVEGFPGVDTRSLSTLPPMSYLSGKSRLIELASSGKHYGVRVKDNDLLRLMAWVDVNGPFLGDEEIRRIPDPDFPGIEALPIRPLCKSAPHVNRAYSQEAFQSGEDRLGIKRSELKP